MRKFRILLALALLVVFFGVTVLAESEDGAMGVDDMGDGAEYGSGKNRALEIDEEGDGDYDSGNGSVIEGPVGDNDSSGDNDE